MAVLAAALFSGLGLGTLFGPWKSDGIDAHGGSNVTATHNHAALPGGLSASQAAHRATVDGYEVDLEGALAAASDGDLVFRVHHNGAQIGDLQQYLGGYGHLVVIRTADDASLRVHPTSASSSGAVSFAVEAAGPGDFRVFLDFKHGGVVRTAAFTIDVPAGTGSTTIPAGAGGHVGH
jgi:hypothetical protein